MNWKNIVQMDDDELEQLGIKPSATRQVLLRNFRRIKKVMKIKNMDLPRKQITLNKKIYVRNDEMTAEEKQFYLNTYRDVDWNLLEDFPSWLKGLGFLDFASCFAGMHWRDIVEMNYDKLEEIGVNSNFVRLSLVKHFWTIKKALVHKENYVLPFPKQLLKVQGISEETIKDPIERLKIIDSFYNVDLKMVEEKNIPALLDSVGLSRFASSFNQIGWDDALNMDYKALEKIGIDSHLARQVIFKKFQNVKLAMDQTRIPRNF
ncbi:7904_t:CDS:2 [Acaulospora morrowiae]|uniref:7904_t:CDS:1 n=1 Tax=Acaulospora morrowiae TaxID=94023 RepID=A0A9N9EEJ4_9GLOM|nr:7904_t:CDS:2 [Acaulospora morrowiae]